MCIRDSIRVAQNGRFSFTVDAPLGSYYVKELTTAGPEYILDDTQYPVVFEYQGPEIPVVQVKVCLLYTSTAWQRWVPL